MSTIALSRPPARLAAHPHVRPITAEWLMPFLLAAAIAIGGLRGVSTTFAHPDAPRHALNGVMIHDWVTQSHFRKSDEVRQTVQ